MQPNNVTPTREDLALLATAVMGWRYWDGQSDYDGPPVTVFTDWGIDDLKSVSVYEDGSDDVTRQWNPYESDADAMGLLDALAEKGARRIEVGKRKGNSCWYCEIDAHLAFEEVRRHAICAAALAWAREQSK